MSNRNDARRLKIHLHRWIIIKACYYIRNMKLKRPSGANDYETLADIDGDGGVSADFHFSRRYADAAVVGPWNTTIAFATTT